MSNEKLIHDMNSNISSIAQALPIVQQAIRENPDQAETILKLCIEKMESLKNNWEEAKKQLS